MRLIELFSVHNNKEISSIKLTLNEFIDVTITRKSGKKIICYHTEMRNGKRVGK